jgi:hypothetical protein|nr:PilZ domain-containing protein [Kofleriaceae bacterium]
MFAPWLRVVYRADDWCAELARIAGELERDPMHVATSATAGKRLFELAQATEDVDPERERALALYTSAWHAGHAGARARVIALAHELRAHVAVAEAAVADHTATGDAEALLAAGRAYLDAKLPERASRALAAAASAITDGPRAAEIRVLLAIARGDRVDPEREIATCVARAEEAGDDAARYYTQALRIARATDRNASAAAVVKAAARRCPSDAAIAGLVLDRVLASRNADDIGAYFRGHFEAAATPVEWVAHVRAAAGELLARGVQPGLGLRLMRLALEHAYKSGAAGVPRHLAAWELVVRHARATRATMELLPLVAKALDAPLSDDDAVYVTRLGLDIAWRDGRDRAAAQPYADALVARVPDHPLAVAFAAEEPAKPPTITFKMPKLRTDGAAAAPPAAPVVARVPSAQIDRAERKVVPVDVVVELPGGGFFSTVVRDLSTTGAFIATRRAIDLGAVLALELRVPGVETLEQATVRVSARVARKTDLGWGVAFVGAAADDVAAIARLVARG